MRSIVCRWLVRGVICLGTAAWPGLAGASSFSISLGGDLTGAPPAINGSPTPVSMSGSGPFASAYAGAGSLLSVSASSSAAAPNTFSGVTHTGNANAGAFYDDILISGPGTLVDGTLHLPFSMGFVDTREVWGGDFSFRSEVIGTAELIATLFGFGTGGADITYNPGAPGDMLTVTPKWFNPGNFSVTSSLTPIFTFSDFAIPLTSNNTGVFAGVSGFENYLLRGEIAISGVMPVGTPLQLQLSIGTGMTTRAFFIAGASGELDATHTFGVPQGGLPVFDLPEGYTANSASLGIVNNAVGTPTAAVPEPVSLVLLGSGLAVLARRRIWSK